MTDHPKAHDGLPEGLAALGEWHISEFTNEEAGLTLKGKFRASPFQRLDADQTKFLITFLRCRGVLSSVERELGISYPTVRARLDALLKTMGLAATEAPETPPMSERHKEIISKLESGELTPEEAKKAMKEAIR
jgi:hypothetical protein